MDMQGYIDNLKFQLTGGLLDLELDDATLTKIMNISLREIQRYINTIKFATIPYHECIDLSEQKVSSVYRVYRTNGYLNTGRTESGKDPLYMMQWQILSGANGLYNMQDYVYNYAAWNTTSQIRNTMSTDLNFVYDKTKNYLYINCPFDKPTNITIEYIPRYDSVDEIVSDYWIDKLCRLSVAYGKIALGRIRTRYTQTNALWTMDGEKMLTEGNEELVNIREELVNNTNLMNPID